MDTKCSMVKTWLKENLICKTKVLMFILGILCEKGEILHNNSLTSNECSCFFSKQMIHTVYPKGGFPW